MSAVLILAVIAILIAVASFIVDESQVEMLAAAVIILGAGVAIGGASP